MVHLNKIKGYEGLFTLIIHLIAMGHLIFMNGTP